jgi:hypothetical protein
MVVAGKLLREAVFKLAGTYKMLVSGPHQAGHYLSNGTKGVLHCPSLKGFTIFGKAAISEPLCKDLKVWNWVFNRRQ